MHFKINFFEFQYLPLDSSTLQNWTLFWFWLRWYSIQISFEKKINDLKIIILTTS